MSRKERRVQEQPRQTGLILNDVKPMTMNQASAFREFHHGSHLVLCGVPGSGKTFIALALALKAVQASKYRKLVIYRSTVATRDMGFLPGSAEMKAAVYEAPYEGICAELYGRDDAWGILKNRKSVEFKSTAHIRGITEENCVILLDECQNMSYHEHNSIITRMGDNCRLIMAGDYYQSDLQTDEKEGMWRTLSRFKRMDEVSCIEFEPRDIVRSGFVKRWIELEYEERFPNGQPRALERVS